MPTAKQYRQQAEQCSELAKAAKDLYAIESLMELAQEFHNAADQLDRKVRARRAA